MMHRTGLLNFDLQLSANLSSKSTVEIGGVGPGLDAIISLFAARNNRNIRIIVAPSMTEASKLLEDISFQSKLLSTGDEKFITRMFPGYGVPVYGKLSPSLSNRYSRIDCIRRVLFYSGDKNVNIILPVQALGQKIIAQKDFVRRSIKIDAGKSYEFSGFPKILRALGYTEAPNAEDPSTYAIHGGVLDVFPPSSKYAYRLDFFDDELESIRIFNPTNQRTIVEASSLNYLLLVPIREIETNEKTIEISRLKIREWCDANNFSRGERSSLLERLANHIVPLETDFLLPYFNENTDTITDYLNTKSELIWVDKSRCLEEYDTFFKTLKSEYVRAIKRREIVAAPETLFLNDLSVLKNNDYREIKIERLHVLSTNRSQENIKVDYEEIRFKDQLKGKTPSHETLASILSVISGLIDSGNLIFFVANTQAQLDRFSFLLSQKGIKSFHLDTEKRITEPPRKNQVVCTVGTINSSFTFRDAKVTFIAENSIFGKKRLHGRSSESNPQASLSKDLRRASLDDLKSDDLVVHIEHGVSKFGGLTKLKSDGILADYVLLHFADSDKLYLPIYRLEKIQKFIGAQGASPSLDKLGGAGFIKNKAKAREAIKDIAAHLLSLYAKRSAAPGHSYSVLEELYAEFESTFPYDETLDQLKAIRDVESDLTLTRPMDRLVCGDVGYGKTEVAIRAAFIVASEGKQVAVLVPTTVLSEQHAQSFYKRFEHQPFRIKSLSRFRSKKEQNEILKNLEEGGIDIIIGTHRLLSKDVKFKNLGLIIIDEEQRFGVEHKEKLKKLRLTTDVLTLTATPIPRTLNLSLLGLRDISIIQTPPADRLAIRTHICTFDHDIIQTGIRSEIARSGQVFFIHNRVQSISTIFRTLSELVPEIKIGVAHGQMPERELEKIMIGFYNKKFDLLLSTAIIENGLDVPSANTIFVNRADTFGLSQLYQIRGRVGRSQIRAQAYLLLPEGRQITEEAKERLQIMQRYVELGSGFAIASHDLEIRGAGDIIGASQSGHVSKIGYSLFMELLEEEVLRLKNEERKAEIEDVEIHAPYPAFIPENYIQDTRSRLSIYRRFSDFTSEEEIEDGESELKERYGAFPTSVTNLIWLLHVKVLMRRYGMKTLRVSKERFSLEGGANPKIDVIKLMKLIDKNPNTYSFSSDSKLVVRRISGSFEGVFLGFRDLISATAEI